MKDYRVVAFVIRNDVILADEHGYENSENKLLEGLNYKIQKELFKSSFFY